MDSIIVCVSHKNSMDPTKVNYVGPMKFLESIKKMLILLNRILLYEK